MRIVHVARAGLFLWALGAILFLESSALAQCSMCRAALAGSGNGYFVRNFNLGVLVLLTPPVAIFCSIFIVLKRYKSRESGVQSPESNGDSLDSETRNSRLETPSRL